MKGRIRTAGPADVDTLVRIDGECFPPDIAWPRDQFTPYLSHPDAVAWLAELPSGPMGFSVASLESGNASATLVTLDVLAPHRGSGVGSALLQACEEWVSTRGAPRLDLQVDTKNRAAVGFYMARDFKIVRTLPGYYGHLRDAWLMRKTLGSETSRTTA